MVTVNVRFRGPVGRVPDHFGKICATAQNCGTMSFRVVPTIQLLREGEPANSFRLGDRRIVDHWLNP
jgi:hypothetical protein